MDLKIGDKVRVCSSLEDDIVRYSWDGKMYGLIDKIFTIKAVIRLYGNIPAITLKENSFVIPIRHVGLICLSYVLDESQIILNQDV